MSALQRLGRDSTAIAASQQYSETQTQTKDAFAFKWAKRETYESDAVKTASRKWLFERYCDNDPRQKNFLTEIRNDKNRIEERREALEIREREHA